MSKRAADGTMAEDDPTSGAETHQSQVAQRHYDLNGKGEFTTVIIYAIAKADGISPNGVKSPPMYESVDVPAFEDAFCEPHVVGDSCQGVGTVEFQYTDYLVNVRSDG